MRLLSLLFTCLACQAFKYESTKQWDLTAPNTLCASGIPGGLLGSCPQNKQEMDNYDAIVMDEHGYVDVTISGLYFTSSSGRRLDGADIKDEVIGAGDEEATDSEKQIEQDSAQIEQVQVEDTDSAPESDAIDTKSSNGDSSTSSNEEETGAAAASTEADEKENESTANTGKQVDISSSISESNASSKLSWVSPNKFHVQIYLVSLDIKPSPSSAEPQHGVTTDHGSDLISHSDFISGNGMCCYEYETKPEGLSDIMQQCSPADMRPLVPRVGNNQKISAPISLTTAGQPQAVSVSARFRPVGRGRYMVVISNCAATFSNGKATPLTAHFDSIKFKFASKFGELPLSMSGIVPFYGVLLALYGILGLIWFRRSKGVISCPNGRDLKCIKGTAAGSRVQARPLLGLQRAIYSLILLQFMFTLVAFAYYVHLNITVVDIDILYGGTMAALAGITPFSILVGTVHFITFLACQAVVMLATDGTWLIQSSIRPETKKALYALGLAWLCFFATNTLLSRKMRLTIITSLGLIWVAFLVFNVRRSLRHLRSLILGQSNETVVAIGGNLVAKRSMYRKFFAVLAIYPIVFAVGVIWNVESQEDSWAWVGYVLVDVYVFIILLHATITWLPRPLAAMEYAKYTPLDQQRKSSSSINDPTVWQETIDYSFDELELS